MTFCFYRLIVLVGYSTQFFSVNIYTTDNTPMTSHYVRISVSDEVNLKVFLAEANSDRVLLDDVKVLTLHHGQSTNARRSSPVPQVNVSSLW